MQAVKNQNLGTEGMINTGSCDLMSEGNSIEYNNTRVFQYGFLIHTHKRTNEQNASTPGSRQLPAP